MSLPSDVVAGHLIKTPNDPSVFVVNKDELRQWVPNEATFFANG